MTKRIKLTEEFLKHIKNCGITADNELRSFFFQHVDGTIITITLKKILDDQKKAEKWDKNMSTLDKGFVFINADELQVMQQEIKQLKEDKLSLMRSVDKYHQKLEKIKEIYFKSKCDKCGSLVVRAWWKFPELKEILDSQEKL